MIEMRLLRFRQLGGEWLFKLKKLKKEPIWKACGLGGIVLLILIMIAIYGDYIQNITHDLSDKNLNSSVENNSKVSKSKSNHDSQVTDAGNNMQVLSKEAVDALVKSAADKKYLEDVFNATSNLPRPKHPVSLQPPAPALSDTSLTNANQTSMKESGNSHRCNYNGQMYVAGDIVKTPQSWIRCMPTLIFSGDKNDVQQYGSPAWVVIQ